MKEANNKKKSTLLKETLKEGFANPAQDYLESENENKRRSIDEPTPENPFSNVMMTDYDYNP